METIEITIKKDYAKQILDDLLLMDAIEIVKKPLTETEIENLWGSWKKESIESVDEKISKMRDEWERTIL